MNKQNYIILITILHFLILCFFIFASLDGLGESDVMSECHTVIGKDRNGYIYRSDYTPDLTKKECDAQQLSEWIDSK